MASRTFILCGCALNTYMLTSTLPIFKFSLAVTPFSMKINLVIQNPICSCRDKDGFTNLWKVEAPASSSKSSFNCIHTVHLVHVAIR